MRLIGEDSYRPAIAWKPEFAVRRQATRRLRASMHLGRFQAVRKAVQRDGGAKIRVVHKAVEVFTRHRRNSVRPAHPEHSARIFENLIDAVARQTLRTGECGKLSVTPAKSTGSASSKPPPALTVLMEGPQFFSAKPLRDF